MPRAAPGHLVEVLSSGLVRPVTPAGAGAIRYEQCIQVIRIAVQRGIAGGELNADGVIAFAQLRGRNYYVLVFQLRCNRFAIDRQCLYMLGILFEIDLQRLCIRFQAAIDGFRSTDAFTFGGRYLEVELVTNVCYFRTAVFRQFAGNAWGYDLLRKNRCADGQQQDCIL